jgi:hypothetical protein
MQANAEQAEFEAARVEARFADAQHVTIDGTCEEIEPMNILQLVAP